MNDYEQRVYEEVLDWKRRMLKKPGIIQRISKKAQTKINEKIPEKAHDIITEAVKNMVKATLFGSNITTKPDFNTGASLEERDRKLAEKIDVYRRTATVEGAGTGAGGFLLGLADFPLLLS
ncbi:MAG: EcsC family protein, partial [Bacillales bacterium]